MQSEMTPEARAAKIAEIREQFRKDGTGVGYAVRWLLDQLETETKRADEIAACMNILARNQNEYAREVLALKQQITKLQGELEQSEVDRTAWVETADNLRAERDRLAGEVERLKQELSFIRSQP